MKTCIVLLFLLFFCTACTALPAEERAFAVVLCVEKNEGYRLYSRIPTYRSDGGYMSVSGEGKTVQEALARMDGEAPMRINLSQLRLLVVDAELAGTDELTAVLAVLSERTDMRMQCAVAMTDAPVSTVTEALKPAAGTRLSKALDLMLEAGVEQGNILPSSLAEVLRMGDRQEPIVAAVALLEDNMVLSGGYTQSGLRLKPEETVLLSLLLGDAKSLRLTLPEGSAEVRDAAVRIRLSDDLAETQVNVTLKSIAPGMTEQVTAQMLAKRILDLLTRLSSAGCDVLGLGRKAAMRCDTMAQWHALNWPEKYRAINWQITVEVNGPA